MQAGQRDQAPWLAAFQATCSLDCLALYLPQSAAYYEAKKKLRALRAKAEASVPSA
jgi:hypothetical protein